jgi:hypothetical protein
VTQAVTLLLVGRRAGRGIFLGLGKTRPVSQVKETTKWIKMDSWGPFFLDTENEHCREKNSALLSPSQAHETLFLQSLQSSSPIRLTWPLKNRQYLAGKATSKPFLETFRSRVRIPAFRPGDYVSLCVNIIFPYQNHLMWWSQPHKNDVLPFCPTKCGQDESRYK